MTDKESGEALIERCREAAKATGQFYAPDHNWDVVVKVILKTANALHLSTGEDE